MDNSNGKDSEEVVNAGQASPLSLSVSAPEKQTTNNPRPDVTVRNQMFREKGSMPSKEQVRKRMISLGMQVPPLGNKNTKAKAKYGKRWIGTAEAINMSGFTPSTLHGWVTSGKIKSRKVQDNGRAGFHYDILVSSLKEMMAKMAKKGAGTAVSSKKEVEIETEKGKGLSSEQTQTTPIDPVSFLFGHCDTFISIYARGIGIPEAPLARGVAELLLRSSGG